MAFVLLGGVIWADHSPAVAAQSPPHPSGPARSLGPALTLAELDPLPPLPNPAPPAGADMVATEVKTAPIVVQLPPLAAPEAQGPPANAPSAATPAPSPPSPVQGPEVKVPGGTPPAPLPLELELISNQQEYDAQLERYVSTGNVSASLAGGRLQAERIEVDPATRTLFASGSVRFQRGQQFFQASRLRYSLLEGIGEMEDVYGVLDLDGSAQDLNLEMPPSTPLPAPEAMSCTPELPPVPEWQPYPWSITGWGGKMYTANFGGTFTFQGEYRPEVLGGVGLQRRVMEAGPLSFEIDANVFGHKAARQPGGPYNQAVPFADNPAQTFAEGTLGFGARLWLRPWLNVYFEEGVSLLSEPSNWEKTERENYATFLNYLAFEVEGLVTPEWSLVGRIHHRSGAYGTYSGVREGSNAYLLGVRHRFGTAPERRPPPLMPPAEGCPGALPPERYPLDGLSSRLEAVAMGPEQRPGGSSAPPPGDTPHTTRPHPQRPGAAQGSVWSRARQAEQARQAAIAKLNQRVQDVRFQQSLTAERRLNIPNQLSNNDGEQVLITDKQLNYGQVRPTQLQLASDRKNKKLLEGTISRWRIQASRLTFSPATFSGERVAFSNDPFTPSQSWMDSEDVVGTLQANGDTVIEAKRNEVVLEDRFRLRARRRTVIAKKEEEVDNPWVFGVDREDRDGIFLGYNVRVPIGESGALTIQPQLLVERALDGSTNSYPYPWQSAGADPVEQPATLADDVGLRARLETPFLGFNTQARLDVTTFNPDNIANGTRSLAEFSRNLPLPLLGDTELRLFGAYRFRTWNGTLGEQDVYSAFGGFLEREAALPNWGRLSGNYLWRVGLGNYQSDQFDTTNLTDLWRANAIGSLNLTYPLWTGTPAPATPLSGLANTPQPVVPGLALTANLQGTLAYYGDGTNQNTLSISGGPTLTLGHFIKPFLDFTQLTITGGGTLRQGQSPFSFDRAVDLGTLGVGLTQQLVGPLVFSGGVGLNVDPNSTNFGEVLQSYLELRWQRRSFDFGVFFSPYDGLGGVRVRLHDFNFSGPGTPFVPYTPAQQTLMRPF
ncbi:MAG: DUF3769 domain-containing protein [Cyanobacteriota bacterium]|nr:DUF3769 domain-containing protein [Cyanobacteriota bacterium]